MLESHTIFTAHPYLKRYGLVEPPYSTKPNERYLYLTPLHEEALAMIGKVISEREGASLIYGKFGTGKTTLMRRVYAEIRDHSDQFQVGVIENAGHCPTDFQLAGAILESFGHKSRHSDRKGRFDQIKQILLDNYKRNMASVLLIDEAQEFPARVLEGLRGYLNFETDDQKLLQMMLFALPNINRKLAYARTLRNRLWRTHLKEMTREECEDMLRWRFAQAGGSDFPFISESIDYLYKIANGHPRTTCGLAQLALESASYADGLVTPETIERVKDKRFLD